MEQVVSKLVEFVVNHIYIVIVIVGLIYTMFFRKSPLEKPPERRPANRPADRPNNRMPDFGGAPMFPQKPNKPVAQQGAPMVVKSSPPPVERREPQREFSRPQEPLYRSPAPVEPVLGESVSGAALTASDAGNFYRTDAGSTVADFAEAESRTVLTRDDLTRAVVWAEILGPPRSKRPFRR